MLIHDIIKMKYVNLGYIKKNYPYHLISDEEMFNAFIDLGDEDFNTHTTIINPSVRFFDDYYPNPFAEEDYIYEKKNSDGEVIERISMSGVYTDLKNYIKNIIIAYLHYQNDTPYDAELPDWVYTYMLGEVVYQQSEYLDIQDTLTLLGCFNIDNEFTQTACVKCYVISANYVSMLPQQYSITKNATVSRRCPTVFGEPHVIKSLRLEN